MNPVHGFFLSSDPKGYANSSSLYVYSAQNPIDLADPDGEFAFLAVLAVIAIGAVVAGALNATRQGIQIAEGAHNPDGSSKTFSWGELGISMGVGGILAPVLVVAPELGIPLAAYGVYGGIDQYSQGNYATGTFDIVTSLAPFGSKTVRNAAFGRGTVIGQARGLELSASLETRIGRFNEIDTSIRSASSQLYNKRFFRGTTYFEAVEAEQSGLNLPQVLGRQKSAEAPPRLGIGLYMTETVEGPPVQGTATFWADFHGGSGRGGGPAVIEGSIPRHQWWWFKRQPGVQQGISQPGFPNIPSTLETFVPEQGGLASQFNAKTSWRVLPDTPEVNNFTSMWPLLFSPQNRSLGKK